MTKFTITGSGTAEEEMIFISHSLPRTANKIVARFETHMYCTLSDLSRTYFLLLTFTPQMTEISQFVVKYRVFWGKK